MGISTFPAASAVATQPLGTNGIVFAGNATQGSYTHTGSVTPGNYLLYPTFSGTTLPDVAVVLPASGTTVDSSYNPVAPTMVTVTSTETALNVRQSTITRWSSITTPSGNRKIVFAAGLYVLATSAVSPNNIFTSTDLVTWTARTSGLNAGIVGLEFGNGVFIAVSGSNNGAAYSSNGTSWTVSNIGGTTPVNGLSFANGTFHTAGQNGSFTTTNGVTWASQGAITGGSAIGKLGSANGLHWVFNPSGTTYRTSPTGASGTWTVRSITGATQPMSVIFANSLYVVGDAGSTVQNIWTSPDLTTWTARTFPTGSSSTDTFVAFGDGKFVAAVDNKIYESFNGTTWSALKATVISISDLKFFNNRFIGVGSGVAVNTTAGIPAQYALYRTAGADLN
jgi:hypothetical protein